MNCAYVRSFVVFFIFSLICGSSELVRADNMKTLVLGQSIESREAKAYEFDKAMGGASHTDVTFELSPQTDFKHGQMQKSGFLINSSTSKQVVYMAGRRSALAIDTITSADIGLRDVPSKPQTSLFVLEIPPHTQVQFISSIDLDTLTYNGAPEAKFKWTFLFWTAPRPTGEFSVHLPSRNEVETPPVQIGVQKFSAAGALAVRNSLHHVQKFEPVAKLTAYLQNISNSAQLFCKKLQGNVNWELLDATGKPVAHFETAKGERRLGRLNESDCSVIAVNETIEVETVTLLSTADGYELQLPYTAGSKLDRGDYQLHLTVSNGAANPISSRSAKPFLTSESTVPLHVP